MQGTTNPQTAVGLHVDTHAIAIADSDPDVVYFGSDGGAPVVDLAGTADGGIVLREEAWLSFAARLPFLRWPLLREYQQHRVCTLLDPTRDPLGKGFHILQGMIAIGSGGLTGKGFMQGTQTHLEFIPERTTDFVFAAFAEEFGLAGTLGLLVAFSVLLLRGLLIAAGRGSAKPAARSRSSRWSGAIRPASASAGIATSVSAGLARLPGEGSAATCAGGPRREGLRGRASSPFALRAVGVFHCVPLLKTL